MKLQHQTDVEARPDDVWAFLQDTAGVVECMPGAELVDDLGDDRYEGVLRVAIGPLKMNYAGRASVVERDAAARRIVLDATGRDKRGSGSVVAHVALRVEPIASGSRIDVVSDIDLTGRIASLGRGIRDVSNQMFVSFAGELGNRIEHPGRPAATSTATPTAPVTLLEPATKNTAGGEIKVLPLIWAVTRERLANFLERLSTKIRPN
ncbi:SRPBCC family protein [Mycolicibacterium brisbanense]|uniref:Carbon monoxide dehydrogenase subunit G (CoxG) family protein n=1 Tax=Mycolicibacterium brisbanense TaxID=146020 RepID=A0A100W1R2_9MYCO|nr:SRPBCC family protein [Mycolicibacterium brisbanense]MCV7159845.1 SRPBCC family protein [Mycolicibacterium brisbanense]GAS89981.1 carbon monoxide dehydrogenase subunit G (CoxG) family protein [Mycolicibacterium brisbanense]